ncbi:MAG: hypothetical protein JNJ77_16165 [Planctomycetia bacterium]|nr:hypothetical protein [Planctomycetia bacterium]
MRWLSGLLAVAILCTLSGNLAAQDKGSSKSGSKSGSKSSSSKSEAKESKIRGVLPQYYRQLGLSDEQRQNIYKIQHDYADKLEELEKKLEDMKAERNAKYLKELTKSQREQLEELKKSRDSKGKDKEMEKK